MARPESQALAGYFPTPPSLLSSLSCLVSLPRSRYQQQVLFDPCAGTGEAIAGLRRAWFGEEAAELSRVVAIEMERERFEQLFEFRVHHSDTMLHSDAFLCQAESYGGEGASVLFLNPPYDHDRDYGRLEQRFLAYATPMLAGGGALLLIVPVYALKASAAYLARHYTQIRAFRFPAGDYEVFRQCAVVARRREHPVLEDEVTERRILGWAEEGESLPILGEAEVEPLEVEVDYPSLRLTKGEVGVFDLVDGFRPWEGSEVGGVHHDVESLIGGKFEVALPPMPAHIALALSAGMLNGKRLAADDPSRFPPLLVKATFSAQPVVVQERRDKKGKVTGQVEVEQPKLEITVLRLDEGTFHRLSPGTVPSGATDVARFNSADLLEHYGQGLLRLLREQFPALHDPTEPAHAIELPRLARTPFRAQAKLIQAALKLLARGDNPEILAEVGTGKTTIALFVAAALSPAHVERTRAELERVGHPGERLDTVRRVLVVCPPHLLKSWADQAAAVVPDARVRVLETLSDLDGGDESEFEIFVLSRETAKLGHAVEGVQGPCPRCGSPVEATPEERASKRLRCDAEERRPLDETARLALKLAGILASSFPQDARVRSLLDGHRVLARALRRREVPAPFPGASALAPLCEELLVRVLRDHEQAERGRHLPRLSKEVEALRILGRLSGLRASLAERLDAALPAKAYTEWGFRAEMRTAVEELRAGDDAEPEEALDVLAKLEAAGRWGTSPPCGEPLFGAVPRPRRYPLARSIVKRAKRSFDLLVVDECHEYRNLGSAQQKAAHRLVGLPGVPTLTLTGSAMSGYASSLFAHKWAVSPAFRAEYGHGERARFAREYGYRKLLRKAGDAKEQRCIKSFGAQSDREEGAGGQELRQIGEAPGVAPLFILKHVLPTGLLMHKADLDDALPQLTEKSLPIVLDREKDPQAGELKAETSRLIRRLLEQIKKDRFSDMAGRLFGALTKLRSYPDLAASECGPFSLCYPETVGGAEVTRGKAFPDEWISPKEAWMVEEVEKQVARGRKVMVFLLHTGNSGFVGRIRRLLGRAAGEEPVFLDASRVSAGKREDWLNKKVVKPGKKVLIVQPVAVQTGLNNLTGFSTAIWYEGVHQDALVVRQANGRLHRPGQTRPVEIFYPHYQGTLQATAHDLVARKIAASMQVDGLSLEAALETAGAGAVDREAALAAMAFGEALFNAWRER